MTEVLERLRPHPHRGAVTAAGAVPLALAGILIELRMTQWSLGARFIVVALIAALILTMGWLAPLEGNVPRAYHSVLLVAGLLVLIVALVLLAEVLGANRPPGRGAVAWTFAAEAAIAAAAARRANSGASTLIAAMAGAVALEALVAWLFEPQGAGTFRAMLIVLTLAYAGGAIRLRDSRPRHGAQLVNAAGLVTLLLALSFLIATLLATFLSRTGLVGFGPRASAAFGWKLYLLAVGFGLLAYAAADREPGPAYLGTVVLLAFAVLAGMPGASRGSLVGWPLLLIVVGGAGLTLGLRPRRALPPEPPPEGGSSAAPTEPLPATGAPPTIPLRPIQIPLHPVDDER